MAVIEGGTFGPGDTFPDGTIFIGCTFYSTCTFGEGCVFENCNLYRRRRRIHQIGAGATMTGGYVEYTTFGEAAQLYNTSVGGRVSFGADSKVDGSIITATGGALSHTGAPVQGSTTLSPDWCADWRCKSPYVNVTIAGISNAPVKVIDAGKEYTIPASG